MGGKFGTHAYVECHGQIEIAWDVVLADEVVNSFKDEPLVVEDLQCLFGAMDGRVMLESTECI